MKFAQDIILKPVITEQSMTLMREQRKYTFKVAKDSNKIEIKKAVEELFNVKVSAVNTLNYDGKMKRMGYNIGRRPSYKKAVVTLEKDSRSITFFDSLM